ncbi:DUF1127 domain-containing protein [Sinorhizobium sp. CB9]
MTIRSANSASFFRHEGTGSPAARGLISISMWLAAKLQARRNRNALLALSDDQLKDIGLSRGQSFSHEHIYTRYK